MKFMSYIKSKNISLRELSSLCGIPYATLYNNIEHPETMKAVNLRKISGFLSLTMDELLEMMLDKNQSLLKVFLEQKSSKLPGNLYHYTQISFAYNTNRIEGSKLTEDETRYIFETNTVFSDTGSSNVNDIMEMANHFYLFDWMLDEAKGLLTEKRIKKYHEILKSGTVDARKEWFNVGEYKQLPNEVGGKETTPPENVSASIRKLLSWYNGLGKVTIDDIITFHYRFESVHPFQDGNGRIGRLIMFKECLKNDIMPFIIEDSYKAFYYRGLSEFSRERGWLRDTCLAMQNNYRNMVIKLLPDYMWEKKE